MRKLAAFLAPARAPYDLSIDLIDRLSALAWAAEEALPDPELNPRELRAVGAYQMLEQGAAGKATLKLLRDVERRAGDDPNEPRDSARLSWLRLARLTLDRLWGRPQKK